MIDSTELTRKGWIRHLATIQEMLQCVQGIHTTLTMGFSALECESDRDTKIGKGLQKLQELVWESGAVSERVNRERGDAAEDFDEWPRDTTNSCRERARKALHNAAKRLEELARGIWDETAPEVVTPEVVCPSPAGAAEEPQEDRRQLKLAFTPQDETGEG